MASTTLVTGAAGFAGSHLIDALVAAGRRVVGWHRPGHVPPAIEGVGWRAVDILNPEDIAIAVAADAPDQVFHCAGAAHVGQAWGQTTATLAANVLGTHHLLAALSRTVPDARVLIPSSAMVYAPSSRPLTEDDALRPASPYGLSKLAQEMVGLGAVGGPRVWIARPFNHFGPRQTSAFVSSAFAQQIAEIERGLRPPEIAVGNLEARRDLTDVRDTVHAYMRILEAGEPERPYNVCTGDAWPIAELLTTLLARSTASIRVVVDPSRYRPNDTPLVVGDRGRIERELGWTPTIPVDQTLSDLLEYWRRRIGNG